MITALKYAAVCAVFFMAGNAVLDCIDRRRYFAHAPERWALSWLLGVVVLAFLQLYAMAARIPLTAATLCCLSAPCAVYTAYRFIGTVPVNKLKGAALFRAREALMRPRAFSADGTWIEFVLVIVIVSVCAIMLAACLLMPLYTYDSRAIWGFKAKVLFNRHTIFNDDFFDPARYHAHPSYPLLVPLTENFFYTAVGDVDEYGVKIVFALMYMALLTVVYAAQRRYFGLIRPHALRGTAIFAVVPCLFVIYSGSVPAAYADFPLSCMYTAAIVYLARFMLHTHREDAVLAVFFFAGALFTKNEGMALFLVALAAAGWEFCAGKWYTDKTALRRAALYAGAPVIAAAPWFIIRVFLPKIHNNNPLPFLTVKHILAGLPTLPLILKLTFREMFGNLASWGFFWYLAIFALFIPRRAAGISAPRRRLEWYLFSIAAVYYFFVLTPLYMCYTPLGGVPVELEFQGTSFERLRLHVLPLLALFASLRVGTMENKECA